MCFSQDSFVRGVEKGNEVLLQAEQFLAAKSPAAETVVAANSVDSVSCETSELDSAAAVDIPIDEDRMEEEEQEEDSSFLGFGHSLQRLFKLPKEFVKRSVHYILNFYLYSML